jgi:hypothetical protein
MPYGGIDLDEFWKKMTNMPQELRGKEFFTINNAIIKLLKEGIMPLNRTGFYHLDIKAGNVLISDYARLIDWGISQKLNKRKGIKLNKFINEFQFNVPFSNILFNPKLNSWLKEEDMDNMKRVAENICKRSIEDKGPGHLNFIKYYYLIMNKQLLGLELTRNAVLDDIIYNFIAEILLKYLDKTSKIFDLNKYCFEIFLPNVDIWGFIMVYMPLIELSMTLNELTPIAIELIKIILKYCYNPYYAINPIPVDAVIQDLQNVNS